MNELRERLQSQWEQLFQMFPREMVAEAFDEWWERMSAPHRAHYHGPAHIEFMLVWQELLFPDASFALRVRIFLHDVVCEPGGRDNELQSIEAGVHLLCLMGMGRLEARRIANGIAVTIHHLAESEDGERLCDLDLLSLGLDPDRYRDNTALIRLEYAAATEEEWRDGREAFLRRMLNREFIYYTVEIRARYEISARAILRKDLEELLAAA